MATASTAVSTSVLNHDTAATPNTGMLRDSGGNSACAQLASTSLANSGGIAGGGSILTTSGNIAAPNKTIYEVNAAGATTQTVTATASAYAWSFFWLSNVGAGTVTIAGVTGTTSLATNAKTMIYSDGTTWFAV